MSKFNPGDLIQFRYWSQSAPPVIQVQERVDNVYILVAPDGTKFLRPVIAVEAQFDLVVTFSDDELLG